MKMMRSHRSLIVISGVLLVAVATILYALPTVARHVAISRLQTITKRPVSIDRVDVQLLSGRVAIHGLHVAEPDGGAPFADCERLEARLHLLSLLRGHIWVRELVLQQPTLRVVRLAKDFNFSDLIEDSGATEKRFDVTVDRFTLVDGTVAFEDRALPERRTWTSDDIQIEAYNVSTLRDDGTVVASSVTAGAPNLVEIEQFRLYPIHLQATVTVKRLDLALARLYLPADAPVVLDRGRVSSTLKVTLDARAGVRADLAGEFEDLALVRPGEREPVTQIPKLTARLTDFTVRDEQVRVGEFEVKGSASVRDRRGQQDAQLQGFGDSGQHRGSHVAHHDPWSTGRADSDSRRRNARGLGHAPPTPGAESAPSPAQRSGPGGVESLSAGGGQTQRPGRSRSSYQRAARRGRADPGEWRDRRQPSRHQGCAAGACQRPASGGDGARGAVANAIGREAARRERPAGHRRAGRGRRLPIERPLESPGRRAGAGERREISHPTIAPHRHWRNRGAERRALMAGRDGQASGGIRPLTARRHDHGRRMAASPARSEARRASAWRRSSPGRGPRGGRSVQC